MEIRFILTAPPQIAEVFEQTVAQNIQFPHTLTRKPSPVEPHSEEHYLFECEEPRAFFQIGILVRSIYVEMDKLWVG